MKLDIQLFGSRGASSSNGINAKSKKALDSFKARGTTILDKAPKGWTKLSNATTSPKGYSWYSNGKSRFGGEYKSALVKD